MVNPLPKGQIYDIAHVSEHGIKEEVLETFPHLLMMSPSAEVTPCLVETVNAIHIVVVEVVNEWDSEDLKNVAAK